MHFCLYGQEPVLCGGGRCGREYNEEQQATYTPILANLCLVQAQNRGDPVNSAARTPECEVAVRRRLAVSGGWGHVALPVVRRVPGSCLLARRRAIRLRKERKRRRRRNPFPLHQKLVSGTTALPCVQPHYTRERQKKRGEKGGDARLAMFIRVRIVGFR